MLVVDIYCCVSLLLHIVVLRHNLVKLFRCIYTVSPPQKAALPLSQNIKHLSVFLTSEHGNTSCCSFSFHKYIFSRLYPLSIVKTDITPFTLTFFILTFCLLLYRVIPINKCKLFVELRGNSGRKPTHEDAPNSFHFSLSVPPLSLQIISR